MHTEPDGVEVVATGTDAAQLARPPLLVLDAVAGFLDDHGLGRGPLSWQRIGDGQSNLTYRIRRDGADVVLRRGPRPPHPPSTHDMLREARILAALRPAGVPVPEVLAIGDDPSLLGVPFYLMKYVDGVVLTDRVPPGLAAPIERARTSRALIEALVNLHTVDVTHGPVSELGRPVGYLERQVSRFADLWEVNATRDLPDMALFADWLERNRPESQAAAVVHGEYRLGNVMFAADAPARVQAILDWELATLGDPLADLGYVTATYSDADSPATPLHLTPVTAQPGYLSRDELVRIYSEHSDLDLAALPWYQALALWKAAVFCEAIYRRWLAGERPDDTTFAPLLGDGVPALLRAAEGYRDRL